MDETKEIDRERVRKDYLTGLSKKEISAKYGLSENTLKSWIRRYGWAAEKKGAPEKQRGAPRNNHNATGHGAPKNNQNAVRHGLFSKYLPDDESREIYEEVGGVAQLDLLWENICVLQTAILRSQKIMYVKDAEDKTSEIISEGAESTAWQHQQAWEKQGGFLQSLSRAQAELRNLIKQYDEMLHRNWNLATEEQQARLALVRAQTDKLTGNNQEIEDISEIEEEIYGSGE